MREPGIPKLLTWRWAPCAALVLGASSFCAFMLLAIPDQIGSIEPQGGPGLRLGNQLSRTQTNPPSDESWGSTAAQASEQPEASAASPANHLASRASGAFPKRGFTPPLDRPAAPAQPAPPPPAPAAAPPPPAPEAQPPAPEPAPAPAPPDPVAAAPAAPAN